MSENASRTILVIDNDEELTRALTKRLESLGFHCVTGASGAQGLAEFKAAAVDLIVSDLCMPGGDGVALAETIRRTSNVPIIFITGFRDDFKRRLRLIENVTTLRKPFNSEDLLELISVALKQHATPVILAGTEPEDA